MKENRWVVFRQDDNGVTVRIRGFATRREAEAFLRGLEKGGHKQVYWIEDETGSEGR